jgi:hypothetical protein
VKWVRIYLIVPSMAKQEGCTDKSQFTSKTDSSMKFKSGYQLLELMVVCNMRTSKKRRKKQSRVIPAGESNVNQ